MAHRIATVIATGNRYLVSRLYLPRVGVAKVFCYGEVMKFKGLTTTHGKALTFEAHEVKVEEVKKDQALVVALWEQGMKSINAIVSRTARGNYRGVRSEDPLDMSVDQIKSEIASISATLDLINGVIEFIDDSKQVRAAASKALARLDELNTAMELKA